jgi:transcriptional regulator with XRE-family HTH domain
MDTKSPTEMSLQIAKRLTALRLQRAWTRETLASHSGVNVHTLKRFERSGQISLERLIALCNSLEMYHEIERVFKPRTRVDVDDWSVQAGPTRQRGRRKTAGALA